ncbi:MAG: hypothetical protein LAT83_19075 [Kiritimatiellae bacterium]|nr:hypothetical protein [Kiritimatiellia bacterium]
MATTLGNQNMLERTWSEWYVQIVRRSVTAPPHASGQRFLRSVQIMKNRIKQYIQIAYVLVFSLFLFYKGRLSLQLEESFAGFEYEIRLGGSRSYVGTVASDGLIKFPWNPARRNGVFILELTKEEQIHRELIGLYPAHGRYFLYSDASEWKSAHVLYIFGFPFRETKIGQVITIDSFTDTETLKK